MALCWSQHVTITATVGCITLVPSDAWWLVPLASPQTPMEAYEAYYGEMLRKARKRLEHAP
jgi:hypothetical protein